MAVAVAPLGVVVGASVTTLDVPVGIGLASSPLLFSGTAQLSFLALLEVGAGALALLGSLLLANARLLLYSTRLAPHFTTQPGWFRWLAPTFIVDQTFAIVVARDDLTDPTSFRRYWLTAGSVLGAVWVSTTGIGGAVGPAVRDLLPLEVAAPALFVGLLVPRVRDRRTLAVTLLTGGLVLTGYTSLGPAAVPVALLAGIGTSVAARHGVRRAGRG